MARHAGDALELLENFQGVRGQGLGPEEGQKIVGFDREPEPARSRRQAADVHVLRLSDEHCGRSAQGHGLSGQKPSAQEQDQTRTGSAEVTSPTVFRVIAVAVRYKKVGRSGA